MLFLSNLVPELPPIDEIHEVTEDNSIGITIDPLEAGKATIIKLFNLYV